jgi:hypothetical protein
MTKEALLFLFVGDSVPLVMLTPAIGCAWRE